MNCVKILLLVSLIPLVLRGVSLLGNVNPSPDGASGSVSASGVGRGFSQRRFGGDGGSFRDEKRFSPTGSNPLHNL
ncbi:hypothetical protein HU200_019541 [Digitaria exilis]|uniref:Uncharacterized protein n=1 Tax=Digitaria exilis TaxID=1010633 RepID=A0A835F3F5_9POAL|nr:hypothetical protein HU200_019541 [Digitaria exilis]